MTLLIVSFAVSWYVFVSPSIFTSLTTVVTNIFTNLLEGASAPGISGLMPSFVDPLHEISKYLFYVIQGLISIGLLGLLIKRKRGKFSNEYMSFSIVCMGILISTIVVPTFAATLNMSRFYHIALFFLAPFSVVGCLLICNLVISRIQGLSKITKLRFVNYFIKYKQLIKKSSLFIFTLLLVFVFLFQVGFIYQVAGDVPTSLPLSLQRLTSNPFLNIGLWSSYNPEKDVNGAQWLLKQGSNLKDIYADYLSRQQVLMSYGPVPVDYVHFPQVYNYAHMLQENNDNINKGSVMFLSQTSVAFGAIEDSSGKFFSYNSSYIKGFDKIFSNGGCEIYFKP